MINVEDMSFYYGQARALKDVSLQEQAPVIAGVWGRNGSGKTTLMKVLSGLAAPAEGTVRINGVHPYNNPQAMHHVTYMQEDHPFSEHWDVKDALRFGSYFNRNWDRALADHLVDMFELPRNKKIKKFSKGMRTMAKITIGLAAKAPVTIMDEPTNGLDAYMRQQFYDALLDTHEESPRLIMLSTHHIEELEPLCEKIAVIDQQTILRYVEAQQLKRQGVYVSGDPEAVRGVIGSAPVLEKRSLGNQLNIMVDEPFGADWQEKAAGAGVTVQKVPFQEYLVALTKRRQQAHEYV